jgi:phage shock protein PspC (stress-responsive transcriptional regulator)
MAVSPPDGDPGAMNEHTVEPAAVKRLERSRDDRMLAGVCGGLARYFDIHPAFYRVGFVVLTLIGGAGILIYLASALVIPDEGHDDSIASAALRDRRDRPWPLVGLGLLAVAGIVLLSRATIHTNGDGFWLALLLAGAAILWLTLRHPREQTETRPPAASGGGDTGATATTDVRALAAEDSRRLRRVGRAILIAIGSLVALLLILAAVIAAVIPVHPGRGIGSQTYVPTSIADVKTSYSLGIGNLRLDLRNVRLPVGETHVRMRVDVGRISVVVPADAALEAHGHANYGQVTLLGRENDGRDTDNSIEESGKRVLVLDSTVGAGKIVVSRAVR